VGITVVSAAAVATGAALLAVDGTCSGSNKDSSTCPRLLETTASGAVFTAAGGAALLVGAPILDIDAVRSRRRR
jgi:hypothetical protein